MDDANQILEKEDPNSFEYNLNKYVIGITTLVIIPIYKKRLP